MPDFKKYYKINATPDEVFRAMTNPLAIQLWSGEPAIMGSEEGFEFELFDGSILGKNLEIEEGKKIVQQWYFGEESNEPSIVTIKLHEQSYGTSVELKHSNIPDEDYEDIIEGWEEVYFAGLLDFFEEDL